MIKTETDPLGEDELSFKVEILGCDEPAASNDPEKPNKHITTHYAPAFGHGYEYSVVVVVWCKTQGWLYFIVYEESMLIWCHRNFEGIHRVFVTQSPPSGRNVQGLDPSIH